jgi:flagella basal body P-ring formation protein FlgA
VNRGSATNAPGAAAEEEAAVKRGQTATLTWDEAGIRVVLPVICLEAGRIGQSVLVRLENGTRTLRAEVVGTRAVRASL